MTRRTSLTNAVAVKAEGKAKELVAIATRDAELREEAEREQVGSGVPDLSATLGRAVRKLV